MLPIQGVQFPSQRTKIPHAAWSSQKKKQRQKEVMNVLPSIHTESDLAGDAGQFILW